MIQHVERERHGNGIIKNNDNVCVYVCLCFYVGVVPLWFNTFFVFFKINFHNRIKNIQHKNYHPTKFPKKKRRKIYKNENKNV